MKEWELRNEWKWTGKENIGRCSRKGGLDNNVGSTSINDKNAGKSLRKKGICRTFHKNNFLIT